MRCARLGCLRSRIRPGNFWREGIAVGPHGAVLEVLLLPDGDSALESINQPAASVECGRAVRRCDRDQHAGFADLQAAQAVHDGYIANLEFRQRLAGQRLHFLQRHGFVRFVIQVERLASACLVAHDSFESQSPAILAALQGVHNLLRIDGGASNGRVVASDGGRLGSSTDWGKERDLGISFQFGVRRCVLLIDSERDGGKMLLQRWNFAFVPAEDVAYRTPVWQLQRVAALARQVSQYTEKKHAHLHCPSVYRGRGSRLPGEAVSRLRTASSAQGTGCRQRKGFKARTLKL